MFLDYLFYIPDKKEDLYVFLIVYSCIKKAQTFILTIFKDTNPNYRRFFFIRGKSDKKYKLFLHKLNLTKKRSDGRKPLSVSFSALFYDRYHLTKVNFTLKKSWVKNFVILSIECFLLFVTSF